MNRIKTYHFFIFICCLLFCKVSQSQNAILKSQIDTTQIRIGEQIKYQIFVEIDSLQPVQFPEGQTFTPMEMVSASLIDTLKKASQIQLKRQYYLTQFDSGVFTIPAQNVFVGQKMLSTQSVTIKVNDVEIDTLKQPLHPIKPMIDVAKPPSKNNIKIIVLLIAVCVLIAIYLLFFKRKRISENEKINLLPPFERAVWQLNHLKESRYLLQSKHKQYYSELIDIIKQYLEKEFHISTCEATTDELLEKIHMLQQQGIISLNDEKQNLLKSVLQRSDLVKFAKSKPSDSVAEQDRITIEDVVKQTQLSVVEKASSNENSIENNNHTTAKNKSKRWAIVSVCTMLCLALIGFVYLLFFANPLKKISEKQWFSSDYGYPSIHISSPWILKRKQLQTPLAHNENISSIETFEAGSLLENLKIVANIIVLNHSQIQSNSSSVNENFLEELSTMLIQQELENQQAVNIITQNETFTTEKATEGVKIFGSFEMNNPYKKLYYQLYTFHSSGAIQQVLVVYDRKDRYANDIAQRILKSADIKTQ